MSRDSRYLADRPALQEIDGDHARCRTDVQALHRLAGRDEVLVLGPPTSPTWRGARKAGRSVATS